MDELRILSGYHRGATLPLDRDDNAMDGGAGLRIGAAEDVDVVLADPGVAEYHARLIAVDGGWSLTPDEGPVHAADSNAERTAVELGQGSFARVGAIWVTLCDAAVAWQDPPPSPRDAALSLQEQQQAGTDAAAELQADAEAEAEAVAAQAAAAVAADLTPPQQMQQEPLHAVPPHGKHSRVFRVVLIPLTACAVLFAAAAYALTAHDDAPARELAAREAAEQQRLAALPRRLPPQELQAALRRRLAEVELLSRVNLELDERQWTIHGALNDDDSERLQRMLRSFSQRYEVNVPINVRIGNAESMLPFRIQQVISGNDASIVTDDGRRLYVGDEYRGMRLAAIAGNQLSFTGKRTLNIVW